MVYNVSLKQLHKLVDKGVVRKAVTAKGNREDIINRGEYIGSPGKNIFFMLDHMTDDEMDDVADRLSNQWSKTPPGNHVGYAACIRYIYGQFEKQGIMRSKNDFNRMKEDKPDWVLPRKFLKYLENQFEKKDNYYGLSILCEMEGH